MVGIEYQRAQGRNAGDMNRAVVMGWRKGGVQMVQEQAVPCNCAGGVVKRTEVLSKGEREREITRDSRVAGWEYVGISTLTSILECLWDVQLKRAGKHLNIRDCSSR